jgi:ferredoxin--NADP+ reductase
MIEQVHTILQKWQLSETVFQLEVLAPLIAAERLPGQFIILQTDEAYGERIPLTIAHANPALGSITLIFQVVGKTTRQLSTFETGDTIPVLVGPLGQPTTIEKLGHVVCVCGGIGAAPMYPIAEALLQAGNTVTVIQGARNDKLLILETLFGQLAHRHIIITDDGSKGQKGLVTEPLEQLCTSANPLDMVLAIGPPQMMRACSETTRPFGIPTQVSLNSIMVDGTGMCGGCRVTVGGRTKFVCVDGPEFDGHLVDWPNMINRLMSYKNTESHKLKCFVESAIASTKINQPA